MLVTIHAVTDDSRTDLLARLRRGDESAWSALYDSLAGDIRAYVARIGAASPDDVLGETMVQVVRSLSSFDGTTAELRPWVFRIARNRVIDAGRRQSRRPRETPLSDEDASSVEGPEEQLTGDLSEMLAGLTPDQRDAVWLRHVVGLSTDDTAAVMGKAPEAVAALTHRALRRLRSIRDRD